MRNDTMKEKQINNIPEEWVSASIDSICLIGRGRVISQKEIHNNPGIYPVFSSQSRDNGKIGSIDSFDFEGEYVTWTTDGAYAGTVFYRNGRFNCTNVCGTLIGRETGLINLKFLAYLLSTKAKKHVSYVGNPKLMNGIMAKIILDFPKSIPEQTRIAAILSKVDQAIQQTEALITKYQRIKTGLMQDLLTKGIDENGHIRSEETHKFKDSPLGRIPEEWECVTIGEISERLRSGVTPKGGSAVYQKEGVMLIRSQNVYPDGLKLDDVAFISEKVNSEMKGSQLEKFDILLNITGASIGRSFYISETHPKSNVNQHVCGIRLEKPSLSKSIYVSNFLNSYYGQSQIHQNNAGSNREGLNNSQLKSINVPWFSQEDEFKRFEGIVLKSNRTIRQLEKQLSKHKSLKTGLMQDLLSGKVRVSAPLIKSNESA